MSSSRVRNIAAACALSLFAGFAASAQQQQTQQLPPGSTTYPIHFPTGSYKLDPADEDTIRAAAAKMQGTPKLHATIIGKADAVGSAELNEHLSQRRAEAVFEALVYTNKVPEDRVDLHWTSEHLPFVGTADEQAEAQNRVVALILHD
jgi:outer membrane protein OmpA-like peptidoglycan-associated protein